MEAKLSIWETGAMTDIMSATILAIIAHLAPTIAALAALIQG